MTTTSSQLKKLAKLPQHDEHWHAVIHRMHAWVPNDEGDLMRPYVLLVINVTIDFILATDVYPTPPTAMDVRDRIFEAMSRSEPMMNFAPHRPALVTVEEPTMVDDLRKPLQALDIELQLVERPELVHQLLNEFNSMPNMGPVIPGLLSVEDSTADLVGDLFAAAAEFYRANPWYRLTDQHPLKIELVSKGTKAGGLAFYVIVMGSAGMEHGISVYQEWSHLLRLFQFADHPAENIPETGIRALTYGDITEAAFDDIDAIEQYGWEVANEYAYPTPLIFMPDQEIRRPSLEEIDWYIAALRGIPVFIETCLKATEEGAYEPIDKVLKVDVAGETALLQITYPAGELPPREEWPSDVGDWLDSDENGDDLVLPDRRAMEGLLAQAFGARGDSPEQNAQEIMYEAWEEQNPARRIILAHEALEISPNCADAYVLLAEEEADTAGRALEYYELGVSVGERAIPEELFKEGVGHFWGISETRPYMRAREGLARKLWQLKRFEEAADHMHELLRLNPSDNQGIRYILLELLFDMDAYDQAQELLDEYDDGMANWLYTEALLAFHFDGDNEYAQEALADAIAMNAYVPAYLSSVKSLPPFLPPTISPGQEDEAQAYGSSFLRHWRKVPGALEWLGEQNK